MWRRKLSFKHSALWAAPTLAALVLIFLGVSCVLKDRKEFEEHFAKWKDHCYSVMYSSRTQDYTDNGAYDDMVEMGIRALPFVMEKIEEGEFFMNHAAARITGVNIWDHVDREALRRERILVGEQGISKLWVQWWKENKNNPRWKRKRAGRGGGDG